MYVANGFCAVLAASYGSQVTNVLTNTGFLRGGSINKTFI